MKIKVYEYKTCSTCKKALKYLDSLKIDYEAVPIVDQPPTLKELSTMLMHIQSRKGSFKNLFNTSGLQYRELGIAQKLKDGLSEVEALRLLAANGKLIKRPFLLTSNNGAVGFDLQLWSAILKK